MDGLKVGLGFQEKIVMEGGVIDFCVKGGYLHCNTVCISTPGWLEAKMEER